MKTAVLILSSLSGIFLPVLVIELPLGGGSLLKGVLCSRTDMLKTVVVLLGCSNAVLVL